MKAGSPHGVKPGRALRRNGPFLKGWGSSLLSVAPRCLETRLPTKRRCQGEGRGRGKQISPLIMKEMTVVCQSV